MEIVKDWKPEYLLLSATWANVHRTGGIIFFQKLLFFKQEAPRNIFTNEFCFHAGSQFVKVHVTIFK